MTLNRPHPIGWAVVTAALCAAPAAAPAHGFDHEYAAYAALLRDYVRPPRVDYAALKANRGALDRVVRELASPAAGEEPRWTRGQRVAFWINAYNILTLRAVVDHYPIRSGWFTLQPHNSIRQIDGVWTDLTWQAAGRTVTLDDIEHRILRTAFAEPRIHFALNCASISCPPLRVEPYRAAALDAQLNDAARDYLASAEGLRVSGRTLSVSSVFKWYGEDFIASHASVVASDRDPRERAVLGVVIEHGPPAAARLARAGTARIAFLDYDWSLNDVAR